MAGKRILKSGPKRGIIFGTLIFVGTTVLYIPLSSEWWIVPVRMAPVSTFLPMLSDVRELGVNPGFYFTITSGITMLTTLLNGRISGKFGRSAVIIPGLTLVPVAMFMLSGAFTSSMLFGAAFFYGV